MAIPGCAVTIGLWVREGNETGCELAPGCLEVRGTMIRVIELGAGRCKKRESRNFGKFVV